MCNTQRLEDKKHVKKMLPQLSYKTKKMMKKKCHNERKYSERHEYGNRWGKQEL